MFDITCCLNKINYSESLEAARSVFERYHIPMSVGRVALQIMPDSGKQLLVVSLLNRYSTNIIHIIQEFADKNNIKLKIKKLIVNGVTNNMIEIKLGIDNVNYESIAEFVLPLLKGSLKNELSFLNVLLNDTEVTKNVVSGALDAIPDDMKNNLVISASECYKDKITEALEKVIANKGIKLDIGSLDIKVI